MPYIKKDMKMGLNQEIEELSNKIVRICESTDEPAMNRAGLINYTFTMLIKNVYETYHQHELDDNNSTSSVRYADYNEVIGVLESCKLEFYRRHVAAYEDRKIKENGDV